jgi:hypothetical protein
LHKCAASPSYYYPWQHPCKALQYACAVCMHMLSSRCVLLGKCCSMLCCAVLRAHCRPALVLVCGGWLRTDNCSPRCVLHSPSFLSCQLSAVSVFRDLLLLPCVCSP